MLHLHRGPAALIALFEVEIQAIRVSERPWSPQYRVLGRALVMLVDSERPILFTTRRVGPKQPRRVVEHHLCGLE